MQTLKGCLQKYICAIGLFWIYHISLFAQTFELQDFVKAIDKHAISLIDNKAQFESMLAERKSSIAWEYPTIEASGSTARGESVSKVEWDVALLTKPKLWWVNALLKQSLQAKGEQYQKTHSLLRNINFINAKRIYLTYVATKEKYRYYLKREENFLKLLYIAKKRLEGGSISRKDYVSFEVAYLDSTLASVAVRNELLELQKNLFMFMGLDKHHYAHVATNQDNTNMIYAIERELQGIEDIEHDDSETKHDEIVIKGLEFQFVDMQQNALEQKLQSSLYIDILDSQTKEYQTLAQYEGQNLWGNLEVGVGVNYSLSHYNPSLQTTIPLPVTKKQSHLKAKYMALESGTLAKTHITKKQIAIKAKAYLQELALQKKYIDVAKQNMQAKQHLAELNRLGYEAQQVTLFEYIMQENAFVDSQIALVNSQIKYINIVAFLEETLGESFTKID
ncbi:TolC family protein [Helicobacter trogontum]|uniref:TolC family protein n=1 Tax=Helicobacter trogontum TaxID=50960 RepID=UPI00051E1195|nr:TolC family protein [Helicobacter trogontum]